MTFNFLRYLVGPRHARWSSIITYSLLERLTVTFFIILGKNVFARPSKVSNTNARFHNYYSFLDIILLPNFLFFKALVYLWDKPVNAKYVCLFLCAFLGSALLLGVKALIAASLTLTLSPIIITTHLLAKPFFNFYRKKIANLDVIPVTTDLAAPTFKDETYGERYGKLSHGKIKFNQHPNSTAVIFRTQHNLAMRNQLRVAPIFKHKNIDGTYFFTPVFEEGCEIYLGIYNVRYKQGAFYQPDIFTGVIELSLKNWVGIQALLKLNYFDSMRGVLGSNSDSADIYREIHQQIEPRHCERTFLRGLSTSPNNNSTLKPFVTSPIFEPKITKLIFQFAGWREAPFQHRRPVIVPSAPILLTTRLC